MDTYKIDWLKIAKRLSPYNIKKGLLYMKHFGPKEFWIRLTERFQADDVDYEADDPVGEKTDIWQMGTVHCECESCQ